MTQTAGPSHLAATSLTPHRFTAADYHRMAATGILLPDVRVELIDGTIINKMTSGPFHADVITWLAAVLLARLGGRAAVRIQLPVHLDDYSEPEPDIAVVRPQRYGKRHPRPDDIFLLTEVAETSLASDRQVKGPLYARHRIPEFWLIDLPNRRVHVHRNPIDGQYEDVRAVGQADETIGPMAFEDVRVDVVDMFNS